MSGDWLYYGVFFNTETRDLLINRAKSLVEIPENWRFYAEHMTIIYNDGNKVKEEAAKQLECLLDETVPLQISSIGISEEAVAFGVDNRQTQNEHSHITIAVAPNSKPVKSNEIKSWLPIDTFSIVGKISKKVKK